MATTAVAWCVGETNEVKETSICTITHNVNFVSGVINMNFCEKLDEHVHLVRGSIVSSATRVR